MQGEDLEIKKGEALSSLTNFKGFLGFIIFLSVNTLGSLFRVKELTNKDHEYIMEGSIEPGSVIELSFNLPGYSNTLYNENRVSQNLIMLTCPSVIFFRSKAGIHLG